MLRLNLEWKEMFKSVQVTTGKEYRFRAASYLEQTEVKGRKVCEVQIDEGQISQKQRSVKD